MDDRIVDEIEQNFIDDKKSRPSQCDVIFREYIQIDAKEKSTCTVANWFCEAFSYRNVWLRTFLNVILEYRESLSVFVDGYK